MPQAVGPLAIAAPDEEPEDEAVERSRSEFPLAASEVRQANLENEPGSHMEADVEIDSPSDRDVTTKYAIKQSSI